MTDDNDPIENSRDDHTVADDSRSDPTRPGTRGQPVSAPGKPVDSSDPSFQLGDLPSSANPSDDAPPRPARQGMSALLPWLVAVLAMVALASVIVQLYLPATDELTSKNDALAAAVKDAERLKRQVEALEGTQAELAAKVEKREREVEELQSTQDELAERLQKEIEKGDIAISQAGGELVVDLIDKVLFDSGEAELNEKGAEVLREVGETLLKVPDKVIQVTGHTDAMPISDKLEEQFPTNWELSTHRATNVVRFLQEEVNVPGERLSAVGRSQYQPIASNKTSKGRRRNRRIEVTLLPLRK